MVVIAFPLLSLENKATKIVIDQMPPFDKIALSLCSTKTKNLIRFHCVKGPQLNITARRYIEYFDMDLLTIGAQKFCLRIVRSVFEDGKLYVTNEGPREGWLTMEGFELRDWIHHIAYTFNQPMFWGIRFEFDLDEPSIRSLKELIKPLPVGMLKTSWDCSNNFILKVLKEFGEAEQVIMNRNPFEDKISIRKIWLGNHHVVRVGNDASFSLDDLLVSNSLNVYTRGRTLPQTNLNRFIKLWMAGSNTRLEGLVVHFTRDTVLDVNQILKGIDHVVVEDTRIRVHRRTDRSNKGAPIFNGGYDIKRRDGTMATLVLNSPSQAASRFVVWHSYLNND